MTDTTARPTAGSSAPVEVSLPVAGMTCASCVNRIERFLRKTPGVEEANVNLATEIATIRYLPDVAGSRIMAVVETGDRPYGPWTGLLIMVLWVAAAVLAGYLVLRQRDA